MTTSPVVAPIDRLRLAVRRTAELVADRAATGLSLPQPSAGGTPIDADDDHGTVATDGAIGFDPLPLLAELDRQGAPVAVIGQVAGILHGSQELTGDLDLLWDGDPARADAMAAAFAAVGATLLDEDGRELPCTAEAFQLRKLDFRTPHASGDLCTLGLPWGALDVSGFAARALTTPGADGTVIRYLRKADLNAMRRALGRTKDLRRAAELEQLVSTPVHPPKPRPGDRVAVLSPSAGVPAIFPHPYELGLRRLREEYGLEPVEYPTTRVLGASPQDRAADINAAFADPTVKAVIATIGGEDQITVLPYLDAELIQANPKPFFGYSDNMNLLLFLHNLGVVGYHGGTVMVQWGRGGRIHPDTDASLRAALFGTGCYELRPAAGTGDQESSWEQPELLAEEPLMEPAADWVWHQPNRVVDAPGWGGNLEILAWMAMADREILPVEEYAGRVLLLETSEELPSADTVYRILRNLGERGLLRQFPALLMARAKAWSFQQPNGPAEKAAYRLAQREAVLRALAEYAPDTMAVFEVDFGHTDPQVVLPVGGRIRVDGPERRVTVWYGN